MAPSRSSKRPAPPSDFKRIKAKVGKRAPKPANYTDTSFQKASIHVASQHQSTAEGSGDVRSSKGRSLTSLAQQLGHTTTSIRLSSAKGILDIVSHRHDRSWTVHLSVVLPALGQCLVDTETTIRTTGLSIWNQVVEQTTETALLPFWNVFVAFLSSAMNALDRRVRRDSRVVAESAARRLPSLMAPHASRLLPALMRMAEDSTFQYHHQISSQSSDPSLSSKRNRNGRQVWLETLVALLQTVAHDINDGHDGESALETNTWNFTPGNTSKNSLFVACPKTSNVRLLPMQKWWLDSAGLGETQQNAIYSSLHLGADQSLSKTVVNEIWTKIRDLLLEILEANNNHETLAVWALAVLALLDATGTATSPESERIVVQVQGMVLAHDPSTSFMGTWMLTLTRLSQALPESLADANRKTSWIPRVVSHLLDKEQNASNQTNNSKEQEAARWKLLRCLLDDPTVLHSKSGRKVVVHLVQNWDERNLPLFPKLYSVASPADRQKIIQCMMEFVVNAGITEDEKVIASGYEFILDKIRDPPAVPRDLLDRFLPVWEKEIVAEYKLESTQRAAATLFMNLVGEARIATHISMLSRLCAGSVNGDRTSISPSIAAFIQDSVFDLRKQLPLPQFLGFLMDGIVGNQSMGNDEHLKTAASYMLGSGVPSSKILKMLWPLWLSWMESKSTVAKRAALCFFAVLATDDQSQSFLRDNLPTKSHLKLLEAIISVVQDQERSASSQKWFQPVVTLLRCESWLWEALLQAVAERVSTVETILIQNFREILREILPSALLEQPLLVGIQRGSQQLEEATQDGPLRNATRELSDCIKAIAATVPSVKDIV
eukprot:scaffold42779_cov191-Amphora_coffeaeformis.AAC.8